MLNNIAISNYDSHFRNPSVPRVDQGQAPVVDRSQRRSVSSPVETASPSVLVSISDVVKPKPVETYTTSGKLHKPSTIAGNPTALSNELYDSLGDSLGPIICGIIATTVLFLGCGVLLALIGAALGTC